MKPLHVVLGLTLAISMSLSGLAQQGPPANPISQSFNGLYKAVKQNVTESAQQVPPDVYAFKPTPEVRSFGQLVGHIADAQFFFCSAAKGEASPSKEELEKTKTTKDDLVKALADSFAYCDAVYSGMTDAGAATMRKAPAFMGVPEVAAASFLTLNIAHDNEHYGNLVTYMRIKGIVPPSTARQQSRP